MLYIFSIFSENLLQLDFKNLFDIGRLPYTFFNTSQLSVNWIHNNIFWFEKHLHNTFFAVYLYQDAVLRRTKEANQYVCGDELPDVDLIVRRSLNCATDIELGYYSATCRKFTKPVCCYCGSDEGLLDDNNDYISDLYTKYSQVRPLCACCHGKGYEAKTWGQKFVKKRWRL